MRVYAYVRVDPENNVEMGEYLDFFKKFGFEIPRNRLICEEVAVEIPMKYRDKIVNLVNYSLEENNILIVKGLDSLGSNFIEISEFLNIIEEKKIILICLDYSRNEIKGDMKKLFFHFVKMGADLEKSYSKNKRNYLKSNVVKRVGRPELLNDEQKIEVIEKFKKGHSVYSLAKEYSVTRTVIQRVLNKMGNNEF